MLQPDVSKPQGLLICLIVLHCRTKKNITWDTLGFGLEHVAPVCHPSLPLHPSFTFPSWLCRAFITLIFQFCTHSPPCETRHIPICKTYITLHYMACIDCVAHVWLWILSKSPERLVLHERTLHPPGHCVVCRPCMWQSGHQSKVGKGRCVLMGLCSWTLVHR